MSVTGCTGCHGDATRVATTLNPDLPAAPPKDTTGSSATTSPGVGAHQAHLTRGLAARRAWPAPSATPRPDRAPIPSGTLDLAWGPLASSGGATPSFNATSLTCANYCHGATLGGASHAHARLDRRRGRGHLRQLPRRTASGSPPDRRRAGTSCGACHAGGAAASSTRPPT